MRAAILTGLLALPGAASADPNMSGSMTLSVWGVEYQGELWAQFRFSGGAYLPTQANAGSSWGTILSHPYIRVSVPEAVDMAAGLRQWQTQHHNIEVFVLHGSEIGLSLIGNDGVTWGPEFQPVVILSLKYWLLANERGEMHGEMYLPLPVAQVEALATALEVWSANPTTSARAAIFMIQVQ
jgi:hypothetical protein